MVRLHSWGNRVFFPRVMSHRRKKNTIIEKLTRFKSTIVTQVETYLDVCLSSTLVEDYVCVIPSFLTISLGRWDSFYMSEQLTER